MDNLSTTFSALSDPTRRLIVDRLTRGRATVNELAEPFAMSQQAVSKHLAYLEKAKIIEKRREGRQHYCSLKLEALREVSVWAESYRKLWEARYSRLDSLLEEMKNDPKPRKKSK